MNSNTTEIQSAAASTDFYQGQVRRIIAERKLFFIDEYDMAGTEPVNTFPVIAEQHWLQAIDESKLDDFCYRKFEYFLNQANYDMLKAAKKPFLEIDGIKVNENTLKDAYKSEFQCETQIERLKKRLRETPELHLSSKDVYAGPDFLPCINCIVKIESCEFVPHTEGSYYYHRINARYIKGCTKIPQKFYTFLYRSLRRSELSQEENRERVLSFIQCLAYFLIYGNKFKKIFVMIGPKNTGKSLLIRVLLHIFGNLGAQLSSYSVLQKNRYNDEVDEALLGVMDKLFIGMSEVDKKGYVDQVKIKNLTGGDVITLRHLHSKIRISKPLNGKILIATNDFPRIKNIDDTAMKDRLVVFDFPEPLEDWEKNHSLLKELTEEDMCDAIFSALVHEAMRLNNETALPVHKTFEYTRSRYFFMGTDLVTKFFKECIESVNNVYDVHHQGIQTEYFIEDLYDIFRDYCNNILGLQENDITLQRTFEMKFAKLADATGIDKDRCGNRSVYKNLRLKNIDNAKSYPEPDMIESAINKMTAAYPAVPIQSGLYNEVEDAIASMI